MIMTKFFASFKKPCLWDVYYIIITQWMQSDNEKDCFSKHFKDKIKLELSL